MNEADVRQTLRSFILETFLTGEDPATLKALKKALGAIGPQDPELVVIGASVSGQGEGRITESTVKKGRLQELVEKEPTLEEAVKELDLELLD